MGGLVSTAVAIVLALVGAEEVAGFVFLVGGYLYFDAFTRIGSAPRGSATMITSIASC